MLKARDLPVDAKGSRRRRGRRSREKGAGEEAKEEGTRSGEKGGVRRRRSGGDEQYGRILEKKHAVVGKCALPRNLFGEHDGIHC